MTKNTCEKLIKKWRKLNKKKVRLQDYVIGKDMKNSLTSKDKIELNDLNGKMKNECFEFLTPKEQTEIKKLVA